MILPSTNMEQSLDLVYKMTFSMKNENGPMYLYQKPITIPILCIYYQKSLPVFEKIDVTMYY